MFDANLLFSDSVAISGNGNSSSVNIKKTPANGIDIEIAVTAKSGTSPTLDVKVQESNNDSSYNDLVSFAQFTDVGRQTRRVQSKKAYLRLAYTTGGTTPNFTVKAGVVSGVPFDSAV